MNKKYIIKKAPLNLMNNSRKTRGSFPLTEMKVGEMFEAHINDRGGIYNAIKHRRQYTGELKKATFTIKTIEKNKVACIRLT